jgi:hypothetical protein
LVITEAMNNEVYKVSALKTTESRRYTTVVHVSHIKGYHLLTADKYEPPLCNEEVNEQEEKEEDEEDKLVEEKSTTTIDSVNVRDENPKG